MRMNKVKEIFHKIGFNTKNHAQNGNNFDDNSRQQPIKSNATHKLKWDEDKLQANEKTTKAKVLMKIDEPNTPFIRYNDPLLGQADDEIEEFSLDNDADAVENQHTSFENGPSEPDEWQQTDDEDRKEKEEAAKKYHDEFEKKRAHHYYHTGEVLRKNDTDNDDGAVNQ